MPIRRAKSYLEWRNDLNRRLGERGMMPLVKGVPATLQIEKYAGVLEIEEGLPFREVWRRVLEKSRSLEETRRRIAASGGERHAVSPEMTRILARLYQVRRGTRKEGEVLAEVRNRIRRGQQPIVGLHPVVGEICRAYGINPVGRTRAWLAREIMRRAVTGKR